MKSGTWQNRIAVAISIAVIGLWVWCLFHPVPSSFILRARWKAQGSVHDLAFSPKGDLLAVVTDHFDRTGVKLTISLWKIPEGRQVNPDLVTSEPFLGFTVPSSLLSFSPDGSLLAVGCHEKGLAKVKVFSVMGGRLQWEFSLGKTDTTPYLAFSPDGRWLAVKYEIGHDAKCAIMYAAKREERLTLLRVVDGKPVRTLHATILGNFSFSPDSRLLAFSKFGFVQGKPVNAFDILRVNDGKRLHRFLAPPHFSPIAVKFSKDGARLWVLGGEFLMRGRLKARTFFRYRLLALNLSDGEWERAWELAPSDVPLRTVAFSPDECFIALPEPDPSGWHGFVWRLEGFMSALHGSSPNAPPTQITLRRLSDGKLVAKLRRFGVWVRDCAFSSDRRYLAIVYNYPVAGSESQIALWERKGK